MKILKWLWAYKKIISVIAFFAITHYYVYNKGVNAERMKNLRSENAVLIQMAREFANIDEKYSHLLPSLPKSDLDTGPAVTHAINGVPKPKNKPK